MHRHAITNRQWSILLKYLREAGIYVTKNLRRIINGIIYKLKTSVPWRDLPPRYGKWYTVYKRLLEWEKSGKLDKILKIIISNKPDPICVSIDSSVVKCHQHSSGARHGEETAIGRSAGGRTTKIHAVCDEFSRPLKIIITAGQVHDSQIAEQLLEGLTGGTYYIADRAYDSNNIREKITKKGGVPVIPRRKNSKCNDQPLDKEKYKIRHTIENFFARMKHFRGVATRFDKLKRSYEGTVVFASIVIWIRELAKLGGR